jgi:hypothetical protein
LQKLRLRLKKQSCQPALQLPSKSRSNRYAAGSVSERDQFNFIKRTTTIGKALLLFFLAVCVSVNFFKRRRRPNHQFFFFRQAILPLKGGLRSIIMLAASKIQHEKPGCKRKRELLLINFGKFNHKTITENKNTQPNSHNKNC